jgi:hypothetical protein
MDAGPGQGAPDTRITTVQELISKILEHFELVLVYFSPPKGQLSDELNRLDNVFATIVSQIPKIHFVRIRFDPDYEIVRHYRARVIPSEKLHCTKFIKVIKGSNKVQEVDTVNGAEIKLITTKVYEHSVQEGLRKLFEEAKWLERSIW